MGADLLTPALTLPGCKTQPRARKWLWYPGEKHLPLHTGRCHTGDRSPGPPHPALSPRRCQSPATEQMQKGCRRKTGAQGCSRTVPEPREHDAAAPQHPLALSHGDPRVGTPGAAAPLAPRSPFPSRAEQKRFVAALETEPGQQTWPGHRDPPQLCVAAGMGTAAPHPTLQPPTALLLSLLPRKARADSHRSRIRSGTPSDPAAPRGQTQRGAPRAPAAPSPRSPSPPERGTAALEPLGAARREDAWDFFFFF